MDLITRSKCIIQHNLRRLGMEIRRYELSQTKQIVKLLKDNSIDLLLDVGANAGQYAQNIRLSGYENQILSFEPLSDAYGLLTKAAAADENWEIAPRCAIGAQVGEITINVSRNSVSSSILPILATHTASVPKSSYIDQEVTPLRTLDSFEDRLKDSRLFIKIDTQGYEQEVINGAEDILDNTYGLQLEMSLVPLYEGQPDFIDLTRQIQGLGFALWDVYSEFRDPDSGRLLQIDAVFIRA